MNGKQVMGGNRMFKVNHGYVYAIKERTWVCCGPVTKQDSWNLAKSLINEDFELKFLKRLEKMLKKYPKYGQYLINMRADANVVRKWNSKKYQRLMNNLAPEVRKELERNQ